MDGFPCLHKRLIWPQILVDLKANTTKMCSGFLLTESNYSMNYDVNFINNEGFVIH